MHMCYGLARRESTNNSLPFSLLLFFLPVSTEGIKMSVCLKPCSRFQWVKCHPHGQRTAKTRAQQQNAPGSLITSRRCYDWRPSVGPWVSWEVTPSTCGPFFFFFFFPDVHPQMRAEVPPDDPPSLSRGLMKSSRPAAPAHAELLALGIASRPICFLARILLRAPAPPENPRGQGLGSGLLLQTTSLMARNNCDVFRKSCRFANCMHFFLVNGRRDTFLKKNKQKKRKTSWLNALCS